MGQTLDSGLPKLRTVSKSYDVENDFNMNYSATF